MKLMWGESHVGNGINSTRFVWGHTAVKNTAGFVVSLRGRCVVTDGVLTFDGQAAAKTEMDLIFAASKGQTRNLRFLNDDNSPTTTAINTADTEGGVTWDSLTWTDAPGGQYATFRQFNAEFSWEVPLLDTWQKNNVLMDYSETTTMEGGTNAFVTHRPVNRPDAIQQVTSVAKVWNVTQSGYAVGWAQLPPGNAPLWADSPPLKTRRFAERSAERVGDNLRRRRVEWASTFEHVTLPTVHPAQWVSPFTGP